MKPLTPKQLKAKFAREGKTFRDWARENGYHPVDVSHVVTGRNLATRGRGHEIAVKLGLKVVDESIL